MVVTVYRLYASREEPIGRAELLRRGRPNPGHPLGALRRGGQLESWRVRYLDAPPEGYPQPAGPEGVTLRTDEPDLRPGALPPPEDYGPRVNC